MTQRHLTRSEEQHLVLAVRSGDARALTSLLSSLDRLVISIARRFRGLGVDLDDLAQEGRMRVAHCATCPTAWEPGREARFSTYAMRAAEWRMVEVVLDAGAVVRVGRDAQRAAWREGGETRERMKRARRAVSGDAPRATGPLFERMPAGGESAERVMVRGAEREAVRAAVGALPAQQRAVIEALWLSEASEESARLTAEVARGMGRTRARVWQVERAAMARLRGMLASEG